MRENINKDMRKIADGQNNEHIWKNEPSDYSDKNPGKYVVS